MVQGRKCFFEAYSYLHYMVLSYINVVNIEGSSHLIFYKIGQACDLLVCLLFFSVGRCVEIWAPVCIFG